MKFTINKPTLAGWYWVIWHGYEFPEVVLITERENEVYSCGEKYMIDCNQIRLWADTPLEKPEIQW